MLSPILLLPSGNVLSIEKLREVSDTRALKIPANHYKWPQAQSPCYNVNNLTEIVLHQMIPPRSGCHLLKQFRLCDGFWQMLVVDF